MCIMVVTEGGKEGSKNMLTSDGQEFDENIQEAQQTPMGEIQKIPSLDIP